MIGNPLASRQDATWLLVVESVPRYAPGLWAPHPLPATVHLATGQPQDSWKQHLAQIEDKGIRLQRVQRQCDLTMAGSCGPRTEQASAYPTDASDTDLHRLLET